MLINDRNQTLHLSFAQQRLWLLSQMDGVSEAYHMPMGMRLSGELNVRALRSALDRIVFRHEALRTTFRRVEDVPVQYIAAADSGFSLQEHDLSHYAQAALALAQRTREEASQPFDMEHGPLFRGQLIRMSESEHVLLLTMHHIVSDGWSIGQLLNELSTLYRSYHEGRNDPLPPLSIQYADYALWQRQWLSGDVLEKQSEYWRRTLAGAPTLLELPTDRPRPPEQTFDGDRVELVLDATLTSELKVLSRRHGVTLYMTVLAAWATVLSRLSGQGEVVIGTPVANRTRPELENLIGCFANTQALRVEVSGSVVELLNRVKGLVFDAQEHQELPFEHVVEIIKPPRNLSHTPIFQAMLAWEDTSADVFDFCGLSMSHIENGYDAAQFFDLTLNLGEMGDRIVGGLDYATALFDRSTIERHVGYLRRILVAMVTDEHQPVELIALVDDEERHSLLALGDGGPSAECASVSLYDLVAEQAARSPDAIAVIEPGMELTYRQLTQRVNGVAERLRQLGADPEIRIAILADRSAESIVGMLGILAAGAVYVPLDPSYPDERLGYVLNDAAVLALVVPTALTDRAAGCVALRPELSGNVLVVGQTPSSESRPISRVRAGNAAYVIYTSGSTGVPKGVVLEHRSAMNLVQGFIAGLDFVGHRFLMIPPLFFDASVGDVFPILAVGATLVLHPTPTELGPTELSRFCRQQRVTAIDATAAMWRHWTDGFVDLSSTDDEPVLPDLTLMTIGGEAVPLEQVRRFAKLTDNRVLLSNQYGPTEAAVSVTMLSTRDGAELSGAELPIGRPLPGVQVYVLDARLQLVPRGVVGELCIGGVQVARGYLNRPELTAEHFVQNPFASGTPFDSTARLYRTGDLVRWNSDGTLQFLGRRDHQVKIRGYRVELSEIEVCLSQHPDIRDALVLVREDAPGDQRLVAYVTAGETAIDIESLRTHLAGALPEYMVPAAYVQLDVLPLTPNGKLDRKALPAPDANAYITRGYEAPIGQVETALAQIWADVLKLDRVGRHDNFFELGGHSLLAVAVIERMKRADLEADVRALFSAPTLMALAAAVGGDSDAVAVPPNFIPSSCTAITPAMLPLVNLSQEEIDRIVSQVPGGAANVQDIYPLAPVQEGILFHHVLESKGDVFLAATLLSVDRRERLSRYIEALQQVIHRHDILRTAMAWEGLASPVQVVWRHAPLMVEEVKLDPADGDIADQLRTRFDPRHFRLDIRQAPVMRLFFAEDAPNNRWVVLETMHHLIGDVVTLAVMQEEIQAHLSGQLQNLPQPFQYRNFVAQARLGVSSEEHEAFFTQMLGDVDEPTDPFGLQDAKGHGSRNVGARCEVDPQLCQRLRACARALSVSLASVCHLAWAQVLARICGREDVVFGTVLLGRMQGGEGTARGMGMFINALPVRMRIGDESARTSVRKMHESLTQLLRHEHASLALVQRCSAVRAPARLFTALLNYRHSDKVAIEQDSKAGQALTGTVFLGGGEGTSYPFGLTVDDFGDGLGLIAQVDESIDPQRLCAFMLAALESLTTALEQAPTTPVRCLEILPGAERQKLLVDFNDTMVAYPQEQCIHELFEAQAIRTPDATALVFEEQTLSYGELNRRANQLAHHLMALGVKPDDRIAICAERSLEMVVGVLGILKAGGAYVPLDPNYPTERLAYMLKDTVPKVLLAHATTSVLTALSVVLDADAITVVDLQLDAAAWADQPATNPSRGTTGLTPEHLAYVIYTSGSTGKPKGVLVPHRPLVNTVLNFRRELEVGPDDTVVAVCSLSFDVHVGDLYAPLSVGARIVLASREVATDGSLLRALLERSGATLLQGTPATWKLLVAADWRPPRCFKVMTEGEVLSRDLAEQLFDRVDVVWNFYGPTEATGWSNCARLRRPLERHVIGRPMGNYQVYILDIHGNPTPIGVAGELYVGGAGVARGYLNRPELNAERFIADPFSAMPHARMYRTGDLGRWLPDGNIEFIGRNDFQVKIRGFRIELGEIEARLSEHASVRDAVVLAREDAPGDKRLVAYVTSTGVVSAEALRAHLTNLLPEYMVPAAYVHLDVLPLTPSGKLDRKALPAPDGTSYVTRGYEAPVGEVETTLARIWEKVLKLERVGRHDDFFKLGGHSLLAVTLIERMRREGFKLDVRALFVTPTLMALAAAVGGASDTIAVPPNLIPPGCAAITPAMLPLVNLSQEEIDRIVSQIPGGAANVQDIYPLAPLQEGFLFHHLMGDEGDTYLLVDQLGFDSRERLERYLDAVRSVVARHDILRTAVLWEGLSEPVQVVLRQVELPVTEIELDPADGDVQAQLYARFDPRRHRVDIRKAPPLRLCFAHDVQNDRWLLHELWHHIARDHATEEVMPSEIQACLLGQADRLPPALPFRNLVAQARLGVSAAEHEAFFREMLGDVEEPTAPFGLLDVRGDGTAIKEASQPVETALVLRLRQQARQLGVSLASLCHLAWAQVLARTSGRDDVVFGTLMFGRMQRGERTDLSIGLFMNTLPLRIRLGSEGVETSVRRVHTLLAGLLRHEHASLALAQRCSAVRAPAPLFTALLNYRHSDKVAIEQDARAGQALTGTVLLSGGDRTSYPFELTVDDFGDDLNLIAQVDESIDPQRLCAFMLAALESLTTALEQAPTMPVRCLEILPGAERRQLLVDFNDTTVAYPQEQCVHELFETQAIQTPVATALVYEEQTLGYGELNRRANQLAHYLIALGVKPDDRIAICAERSLEMVVGVLGILKAGGAYVPLDPNYPTERLAYMLKDTVPKVLLAHATTSVLTALSVVLDADAITVVDLQLDAAAWADQPATNPSRGTTGLTPEHLAYVIYTSGSTGKPKGVLVPHRPLVNTVLNFRREPGLGPDDTVVAVCSLSFDMHVGDLHVPLSVGARIVLASREVATDGSLLRALLERSGATLLQGTPATWKLLVAAGWRPPRRFKVMTEGEALPRDLAEQLLDRVDVVWNLYGPTETTVWSTCARLRRPLERIVIGRPMPNVQVYILDVHGNPTPIGVAGELYIGGAGVARGYLNRPELNAERFIADPFSAMPHARMYRTGDLGRWLPDGNIEFIGRNDFQVKIRGFRIELGEIEARLSEHASVRDAMVLAREDTPGDKRLVAYVTSTGVVSAEALRAHLTNLLPEYMVPAAYVHLDVLPLTPSGKLDRKALPAPDGTSYVTRGYEAPVGEVETTLARIWEKVLKLERVGRHDNFFELGGHSLSAIQLVAALQRHFNAQISDIFRCPSLIEQAQHFRPSGEALQQPIDRAKNSLSTGAERYEKMMTDVNYQPSIAANGPSLSGSSDPHPSFKADVSGHGRPMILIAGLASSGDTFKTTVEHFTGEYECHVLTLAGFAGVPPIDGPLLASAKRDLAEYIRANHLGKPVIVGHSLGGFLAVDLAAKHPDLVGPLVIVDSLPFFAGPWFQAKTLDDAKPMIESMHAYMSNQPREQYDAYAHTGAATKYMVTNPSDWETIKQWGLASDPKTVSNAMYELLGEDLRPQLSKITVPVLVLGSWSGQHEQLGASGMDVPRAKFEQTFEEQYQGLRTLHFAMADTARHFIMLDDPQWFFAQVDGFLRDPVKTMQQRGFRGST